MHTEVYIVGGVVADGTSKDDSSWRGISSGIIGVKWGGTSWYERSQEVEGRSLVTIPCYIPQSHTLIGLGFYWTNTHQACILNVNTMYWLFSKLFDFY